MTHVSFSHDSEYLATAVSLFFPLGDLRALLVAELSGGTGNCRPSCEAGQSEQCGGLALPRGFGTLKGFSWLEESLCKNVTSHSRSADQLLAASHR